MQAEQLWEDTAARKGLTGDQWNIREIVRFTVKVQDTEVKDWMRKSGETFFCEPWHKEKILNGEVPLATADPAATKKRTERLKMFEKLHKGLSEFRLSTAAASGAEDKIKTMG